MPETLHIPHPLNLVLRPWRGSDLAQLITAANHPQLAKLLPHPYSEADALLWLHEAATTQHDLFWAITVDDAPVGGIGFRAMQWSHAGVGVVGYWLTPAYWQQGIVPACLNVAAKHALENTPLRRLEAGVYSSNPASMRVLEKAGFTREAELKRRIIAKGDVLDEIIYARFRPEA